MFVHKSINVGLVFIAFILAVVTAAKSQKAANALKKADDAGLPMSNDMKNIIHLNNSAIATSVFTAVLLALAFGAFHFTTKNFAMVKGGLCVVVLILGFLLIGFSGSLMKYNSPDTAIDPDNFVNIGLAAGIFSLLAVGSCSLTVLKMLK